MPKVIWSGVTTLWKGGIDVNEAVYRAVFDETDGKRGALTFEKSEGQNAMGIEQWARVQDVPVGFAYGAAAMMADQPETR